MIISPERKRELYRLSQRWHLIDQKDPFIVDGISLAEINQQYIWNKLVGERSSIRTTSGRFANASKAMGFDWQLKFLYSLLRRPKSKHFAPVEFWALYDVRNKSVIGAVDTGISHHCSKEGKSCLGVVSDPALIKSLSGPLTSYVSYSHFYRVTDEINAIRIWQTVWRALSVNRPHYMEFFVNEAGLDLQSAKHLLRYIKRIFKQSIRDILAIERLAKAIPPQYIVTGTDQHKLARICSGLGRKNGWSTISIQHGGVLATFSYVPLFTDYMLLWGEEVKRRLIAEGVEHQKLIVVGNPRYDILKEKNKTIMNGKRIVVLTNPLERELIRDMLDILVIAIAGKGVSLVVKPHPSESIEFYKSYDFGLIRSETSIVTEKSVLDLVSAGDLVITVNSSAGIEALICGAELAIFDKWETFSDVNYISKQVGTSFRCVDDLNKILDKYLSGEKITKESARTSFLQDTINLNAVGTSSKRISEFLEFVSRN